MNLYLAHGTPPTDTQHLEMVVRDFRYTPLLAITSFDKTGTLAWASLMPNIPYQVEGSSVLQPWSNYWKRNIAPGTDMEWSVNVTTTNGPCGFFRVKALFGL